MLTKPLCSIALIVMLSVSCHAQEATDSPPVELQALKALIGVWDAEIEVWSQGLDAASTKFKGVETIRAFGQHWIVSDFDSQLEGQTMSVHSVVGYDLNQKSLVGIIIDDGPYAANLKGDYDPATKTVNWMTKAKDLSGNPMLQKTQDTLNSPDERVMVMSVPGPQEGEFTKFMQITFRRRK